MKLNTKSRMAIAAILDVAVNGTEKPVALAGVSERQDISLSYLEQLFRMLREQGFVQSSRGPGGGYRLNKRLASISVADIVDAVDKKDGTKGCQISENCHTENSCHAHSLWNRVDEHLQQYLRTVTLESILEESQPASYAPSAADAVAVPTSYGEEIPLRHEGIQSPAVA